MIWKELLAEATEKLAVDLVDSPEFEARQICFEASGADALDWVAISQQAVTEKAVAKVDGMVARRLAGEPLQYVLGSWGFRSLDLMVDKRVLIPRPETEEVAGWGIEALKGIETPRVLDLGTGSGAIGLSIATEVPGSVVTLSDASEGALEVARANLAGVGMAGSKVDIRPGSWFDVLAESEQNTFDLIISNPPYIGKEETLDESVTDWEPSSALISGDSGFADPEYIIEQAPKWLKPGGYLVIEHGHTQSSKLVESASTIYAQVESLVDMNGVSRAIRAKT